MAELGCKGRAAAEVLPVEARRVPFKALRVPIEALRVPFEALRVPFEALRVPFKALRVPFEALRVPFKALRVPFKALIQVSSSQSDLRKCARWLAIPQRRPLKAAIRTRTHWHPARSTPPRGRESRAKAIPNAPDEVEQLASEHRVRDLSSRPATVRARLGNRVGQPRPDRMFDVFLFEERSMAKEASSD